jgi:NAD(P) transhydrogenase
VIATSSRYDLVAIGSGPAGRCAALQAARLGRQAAIVEREDALGGGATNTGMVPSKTLRAAILDLTGRSRGVYGSAYRLKQEITADDLLWRTLQVIEHEREAVHDELRHNRVDILRGTASFVDAHTLEVCSGAAAYRVSADIFVIAVGTRAARPAGIDFDGRTVLDSEGIQGLAAVPRTLTVVGADVIGLEYATMAAALGTRVTLVEKHAQILDFVDGEIVEALQYHLCGLGLAFMLGEEVEAVDRLERGGAVIRLGSGKRLESETVLHAGRQGATEELNLAAAGLEADARGRIAVDADFRTGQPHIFAAGDVVGSPHLAATAQEQGRSAALAAFGERAGSGQLLLPFAIYTIPEIAFVGRGERELIERAVPYVVGAARYRDLARGEIEGERTGFVKLLVSVETRELLGVHIFGQAATELVHVGQTAMAARLRVDYFLDAVFNVPTYADAYRVAAIEAAGHLDALGGRRAAAAA